MIKLTSYFFLALVTVVCFSFTGQQAAPGFTLQDINGNKVSLSDFKGKVVYMDIWATWCGPCVQSFPKAKKLKEAYKNNEDLVFLYVNIDKHRERWKGMVKDMNIEGVHLNSKEGKEEDIRSKYNVAYIPRYILIDKKGNIYDPMAKAPDDPKLLKDLEKLLGQNSNQ